MDNIVQPQHNVNFNVATISHSNQPTNSVGNYRINAQKDTVDILVSDLGNWKYSYLIALHGVLTSAFCRHFDLNNNSKHNIIVRRQGERQGIVQQHINGVGNIYAPEIIIYK